jgi:hypothetical protein
MTTNKLISALFATAMLFQASTADAGDSRVGGVPVSENGAGDYRQTDNAHSRKPWELERPRHRGRHSNGSRLSSSNNSNAFEHTVLYDFAHCRHLQLGRGIESCALRVWVDVKSEEKRSLRAYVRCSVEIEMTYEGGRVFTRSTWYRLGRTAWLYNGSGRAYMGKRIYGERMNERLIDAEIIDTDCSVYRA